MAKRKVKFDTWISTYQPEIFRDHSSIITLEHITSLAKAWMLSMEAFSELINSSTFWIMMVDLSNSSTDLCPTYAISWATWASVTAFFVLYWTCKLVKSLVCEVKCLQFPKMNTIHLGMNTSKIWSLWDGKSYHKMLPVLYRVFHYKHYSFNHSLQSPIFQIFSWKLRFHLLTYGHLICFCKILKISEKFLVFEATTLKWKSNIWIHKRFFYVFSIANIIFSTIVLGYNFWNIFYKCIGLTLGHVCIWIFAWLLSILSLVLLRALDISKQFCMRLIELQLNMQLFIEEMLPK